MTATKSKRIKRITILVAMQEEARPIINRFKMKPTTGIFPKYLPFKLYRKIIGNSELNLVTNGIDPSSGVDNVGTQPATLSAYLALEKLKPDLLINAGTAGGFKAKNAAIGTVYASSGFSYHDRRISLPGFRSYGIGKYPAAKIAKMAKALHLESAIISTGNSLDIIEKDLEIILNNNAKAKEMEAAAIAWVARLHNIPFFALKSITNLIDQKTPSHRQFSANLKKSTQSLNEAVFATVNYCLEKKLSELA